MRYFILLLIILFSNPSNACECNEQPLILNLYTADVVFTGTAIDKTYSEDSTTYTITFKPFKFYKNNRADEDIFKFTKVSEDKYSNQWSSCDYHLNPGGNWLIIANYAEDEITFGYCSESRNIDNNPLSEETLYILSNLDNFNISQYRFSTGGSFTRTAPLINIDSLINNIGDRKLAKQTQLIVFDFDLKGNLTAANFYPRNERKMITTKFSISWFENIPYAEPKNEFEKIALELARKIKKWTPIYHRTTGEPVLGRTSAFFTISELGQLKIEL